MIFTDEIISYIKKNVTGKSYRELTDSVNLKFDTTFSLSQIVSLCKRKRLNTGTSGKNVSHGHAWSNDEIEFLKSNYPICFKSKITKLFNEAFGLNLKESQVLGKIKKLKLHTSKRSARSFYRIPDEFLKHSYKIGNNPHNKSNLGTEIIRNGYRWRKVKDPDVWLPVHKIIWEDNFGQVPEGYVITFLDGNKLNVDINNLSLISKKATTERMRLNLYTSSTELSQNVINLCELNVKIRSIERRLNE